MLSAECNGARQPAGVKARDGKLWFPTQNGVVVIDPNAVTYNTQPPVLTIESVVVDRADAAFRHGVELSPGQSDLEINYSAPSSVKAEHIQFKYKLEGLEDGWIEAGSRRTVHYSHLSPGSYVFRLAAANSDGVWNETGTTLVVRVKPYFYQTGWFLALCLFGAVGTGSGGYAWRIQQLKATEKRLTRLVEERTAEVHERSEELKVANAMLAELATIDPLTNVANRRRFTTFLNQEWQRAQRTKSPLSLLLIDVDHFKAYNDSYGHQAGDDCLRKVGGVLNDTIQRAGDLAARYGGEEFVVILSDTNPAGALAIAETICGALETAAIPHAASPVSARVTVSIGVATAHPDQHSSPNDLIAACDRALYRAKESGRNRCVQTA
jgi:diguanylate cyclase (GGDEF)-like protein